MMHPTAPWSCASFGFSPPPALAVTGDHDLALHIDADALQRLVVVGHAVVGA